jgi:diguanylate cyclase (GGDEF)-like protein
VGHSRRERRIRSACLASGFAGLIALAIAGTRTHGWSRPELFIFFTLALAALQGRPVRVAHEGQLENLQLDEAAFVPMALLLSPLEAMLALGLAVLFGHVILRKGVLKTSFNLGQMLFSSAVGLAIAHAIGMRPNHLGVRELVAAVVGGLVFTILSAVAVALIVVVAQSSSLRTTLLDGATVRLTTWLGSFSLGVLLVAATLTHEWVLPLVIAPFVMLQVSYSRAMAQWRERQRMEALYDAAVSVRSSMEPNEVRDHVVGAARNLMEASEARLVAPTDERASGSMRAEVDAGLELEVSDRIGGGTWSVGDEKLLRALAGVAAGALHNARLFEQIKHQALYDSLTGLPNQVLFEDRVSRALEVSTRHSGTLALAYIDLDGFKKVNDSLGHTVGNELLQQVAERLVRTVRPGDTVARMGGDEFTLLLPEIANADAVGPLAERILDAFRTPFILQREELFITPSIGIALCPHDGNRYDTLLKNADSAMYRAKERGRSNYQLYASGMNASAYARLALEGDLHNALSRGELRVLYQPQVSVATGAVVGVEALVRWEHPVRGIVPPDHFIPLAEETGLIVAIDNWVMREACRQGTRWTRRSNAPVVAVNLSGRHFQQPDRLLEMILRVLDETGLPPSQLELEVTEGVAVQEDADILAALDRIKSLGVQMAIDDFGTGYSVLNRLRHFPVDKLKIDKSFVQEITTATDDAPMVTAMIAMARSLGLSVLAEGVETPEQLAFLRRHGCEQIQGYLFSRPITAREVGDMLLLDQPAFV